MTITPFAREHVLIIGCGDIGWRLAQQLGPQHYQVTGMRRHPPVDQPWLKYHAGDATQADDVDAVISSEADVIVISMTPGERSDSAYERAYVHTCRNLVTALQRRQQRPRLIVFVSSTAVYGQDDGAWVDETSTTEPPSFSGQRLLEAERIIRDSGFTHTIVRFSGIYGPGRNRLIEQVKQRRASASGHITNRIHADDCAGALAHLINLQQRQLLADLYIATDSCPAPMIEVVSWLAGELGMSEFLAPEAVNERSNKRLSNQQLLASGYRFRYADFRAGYGSMIAGARIN